MQKALEVLSRGARAYPERRQCFACHHQTLPLLAARESRRLTGDPKADWETEVLDFAVASFRGRLTELNAGEGIGGKGLTVGYGLWTFQLAERPPDDVTRAMVAYLLKTQSDDGHWELHSIRPPAEESVAFATVLAAAGISQFADNSQTAERDAALAKAKSWLTNPERPLHEDRVARVWGWKLLGGPEDERDAARIALLATQRTDGGWQSAADLPSDAYATATALYALLETGLPGGHEAVVRGTDFLRRTQKSDGSWHVVTRATPVQVFFDNGDPHDKDQFISMMATGWAAAVLARAGQ